MKIFSLLSIERWAEKLLPKLMMLFLVYLVTAASFNGFFDKWHLREGDDRFGIEKMIDETATRPFVYRQLIPQMARMVTANLPEGMREKRAEKLMNDEEFKAKHWNQILSGDAVVARDIIKKLAFCFFFASVWVLFLLMTELLGSRVAGMATALLFALLFPVLETNGGYYYDFGELFFFFLAVWFALRGQLIGLFLITPFATWNKEAFFFFLPTLFPFHWKRFGWKKALLLTVGTVFVSGLSYLPVHLHYAGNPGNTADLHFGDHVRDLFHLKSYFYTETTYGLRFGSRMFFLHVVFVLWLVFRSWRDLPMVLRQHIIVALAIAVPMYWMFCAVGELRNLSALYPSFVILLGFYLRRILQSKKR